MIRKIAINLKRKDWFNSIEPFVFTLLLMAGIIPLLFSRYFVTLDGPAHLYNANLIREMILGNQTVITDLFAINRFPVPNWSGHFVMALLHVVLPAWLTEKGVFLLYFILTPLFFRKFLLHFYPGNRVITYFMLLFVHNHNLYFGFLNMSLGILLLFITGYYFVTCCRNMRVKNTLVLALLLLAVYFSHVMILLVTYLFLAVTIILLAQTAQTANGIRISNAKELKCRSIMLIVAAMPSTILALAYFLSIDSVEKGTRLEWRELMHYIIDIRPLLTLCYCDSWTILTHILAGLFVLLIVSNLYLFIRKSCTSSEDRIHIKSPLNHSLVWFLIWMSFLILFLIVPNAILLTERLILLFYLFFIIWLASLRYPRVIKGICFVTLVYVHIWFINRHYNAMRALSRDAERIVQASEKIKTNSMVLTLNYSDHWLHSHITGYLGSNRALGVLENYEGALRWFPVQWKNTEYQLDRLMVWGVDNKQLVNDFYVNEADSTCFSLKKTNGQISRIPYVFILNKSGDLPDNVSDNIRKVLAKSYHEIHADGLCRLYELKYPE